MTMTAHEKRQSVALSLIMALFDMVKRGEEVGCYRYRKAAEMEIRVCNLVNDWRNMSFDEPDLKAAGDICDMVEAELVRRFYDGEVEAPPVAAEVDKAKLIRISAELVTAAFMPSDLVDDYPQKTYAASKVAALMVKPRERLRELGVELKLAAG
jgi:hypothetical protein